MPQSLLHRVVFMVMSVFTVAWITVAAWEYVDSTYETADLLDEELRYAATVVMGMSSHELVEELSSRQSTQIDVGELGKFKNGPGNKVAFQIWRADGQMVLRTSNAPQTRLTDKVAGLVNSHVENESWRVFALTDNSTGFSVLVGEHESVRDKLLMERARHVILPLILGVPIVGLLTWFASSQGLKPLSRLADQVARRRPDDFSAIDLKESPHEAAPLINALNGMFGQLRQSFENTRRFTADAAHELGTPLGAIAVQTDVAMLATDDAIRSTALNYVKRSVRQLTRMLQQLLMLARCDAELADLKRATVNLVEVACTVVLDLKEFASSRDITLKVDADTEPKPLASEMCVYLVLRNLLDNAIRYTPKGGSVEIEIRVETGFAVMSVRDTGPGVAPEFREHLFQRFYRAGRTDGEGSGLGLSIVERCVQAHEGMIAVDESKYGGLAVTVRLPLRDDADRGEGGGK